MHAISGACDFRYQQSCINTCVCTPCMHRYAFVYLWCFLDIFMYTLWYVCDLTARVTLRSSLRLVNFIPLTNRHCLCWYHVCTNTCVYVYKHVCMHTYISKMHYRYTCAQTLIFMQIHSKNHAAPQPLLGRSHPTHAPLLIMLILCAFVCICMFTYCSCVYVYICTNYHYLSIYIYIYIYIYICTSALVLRHEAPPATKIRNPCM